MTLNDPLANMYSQVLNGERRGKETCLIKPASKLIKENLKILEDNGYIRVVKEVEDGKGNVIEIKLTGNINKCGVIKPRHAIRKDNYEKFERRFLPAKDFGLLIVSTSKGLLTHVNAKKQNMGGKLIAYCY